MSPTWNTAQILDELAVRSPELAGVAQEQVYAVREVPTDAPRAMKIVRHRPSDSVRDRVHTAWFFEQLATTGAVARYYHMGHWF
jgi:hypothetical protein